MSRNDDSITDTLTVIFVILMILIVLTLIAFFTYGPWLAIAWIIFR